MNMYELSGYEICAYGMSARGKNAYGMNAMGDFGDLYLPAFPGLVSVVKHLYKFFHTLFFLSTREFHVNTNILNYYVFKCIPCMYDNINK